MNSYFSLILMTTNLKIRLRNQCPTQGRVARGSQALIQNFWFVPVRWLKIDLGCFCFQKCWNIIHRPLRKKSIYDVNLSLGLCDLLWDCEIWFKTMSLMPKLRPDRSTKIWNKFYWKTYFEKNKQLLYVQI